jgi:tetratricopeptide (TPR) repeat protein
MNSELSQKVKEIMEREMQSLGTSILSKQCVHLNILEDDIRPEDLPALASRLSELMKTCGGYDKAKRVYRDIGKLQDLDELAEKEDDIHKAEMLENLAVASLYAGEFLKASEYLDKLLADANAQDNKAAKAKYLNLMGTLHKEKAEFDLALALFEKALIEAEEADDPRQVSKAFCRIGDVYWYKGDFRRALAAYMQAVKKGEDDSDIGAAHVGLGNVYQGRNEFAKAIKNYVEALSKLMNTDNYRDLARAYNNLGDTYMIMQDWENALENFKKGEEFGEKGGWVYVQAFTMFNSAEVLVNMGEPDKAKEMLDKSIDLLSKIDSKPGLAGAYHVYGMYFREKQEWDMMEEYYRKSIAFYDDIHMLPYVARYTFELGKGYKAMGDKEKALAAFKDALRIYKEIELDPMIKIVKKDIIKMEAF